MCVVSNIGDHYGRQPDQWPWTPGPYIPQQLPPSTPPDFEKIWREWETKRAKDGEVESLKKRIEALEELIRKGKEFDAATGQPGCEIEEKRELLRRLAKELGVEITL